MKSSTRPSYFLRLALIGGSLLAATLINAETTTTTTTTTNPDGSQTTTVQEVEAAPPPPPAQSDPNLIGPTGATGVIRRSDRRQDRRAGDPRID